MIALIEGSRGVLMASDTDTTAGRGASARSYPCSVWRLALMPAVADLEMGHLRHQRPLQMVGNRRRHHVAVGIGRLLAEQHQLGVLRPRSASPAAYAVPAMSEPASAGSESSTARSAPSASAFESAREALSGPMQTATISATSAPRLANPHGLLERMHVERIQLRVARPVEPVGGRIEPARTTSRSEPL